METRAKRAVPNVENASRLVSPPPRAYRVIPLLEQLDLAYVVPTTIAVAAFVLAILAYFA